MDTRTTAKNPWHKYKNPTCQQGLFSDVMQLKDALRLNFP